MANTTDDPAFLSPKEDPLGKDNHDSSIKDEAVAEHGSIDVSSKSYRKLVHHIDRRLIVTTGFMYCVSLVDRTNIGAANIAGMSDDLGLNIAYRYVS